MQGIGNEAAALKPELRGLSIDHGVLCLLTNFDNAPLIEDPRKDTWHRLVRMPLNPNTTTT
jgi:hypothetical protein